MSEHSRAPEDWKRLREGIVGLGKQSIRKSYYPELQRRLQELEEGERKYRALVEDVSDWIWEIGADGRLTYASPRIRDLLNYEPEEVLGLTLYNLADAVEAQRIENALAAMFAAHATIELFECVLRRNGGGLVAIEISAKPLSESSGKLLCYRGTARNITRRKAAEEALIRSERRLSDIVEFLPDPTFAVDNEDRVTVWNKAIEKLTGVPADEMIGKSELECGLIVYGERRNTVVSLIPASSEEDEKRYLHFEREDGSVLAEAYTPLLRPGGTYMWVKASTLYDSDGRRIGAIESIRDVTERKLAEQALEDSEEKFRALAENAQSVIFIGREWGFIYTNPFFSRVTGYRSDELQSFEPSSLIHPDFKQFFQEEWKKQFVSQSQDGVMHCEFKILDRSGGEVWIDYLGSRIEYQGKPAVVGVGYDITLRKHVEEEKKEFYRDTIQSATNGKLKICDRAEVESSLGSAALLGEVRRASELSAIRVEVYNYCERHHLDNPQLNNFILGVGEALDNALKHAGSGRVYADEDEGQIRISVLDEGPGIGSLILPKAVLRRGFSTKPSLGLGYSIMIEVSDEVMLGTGRTGTAVVLVKSLHEEAAISLDSIPDTWEGVGLPEPSQVQAEVYLPGR